MERRLAHSSESIRTQITSTLSYCEWPAETFRTTPPAEYSKTVTKTKFKKRHDQLAPPIETNEDKTRRKSLSTASYARRILRISRRDVTEYVMLCYNWLFEKRLLQKAIQRRSQRDMCTAAKYQQNFSSLILV